jgi:hypothetical protein
MSVGDNGEEVSGGVAPWRIWIENLTNGHVAEVKIILTSLVTALAV